MEDGSEVLQLLVLPHKPEYGKWFWEKTGMADAVNADFV